MEWDPFAWYALSPDRANGNPQAGAPQPSALDWFLLQAGYEVMASESYCTECGAHLGHVRVAYPDPASTARSLASFATRCKGWRRHRLRAEAIDVSGDLVLGPFTARRPRGQP
jgi:hypothetical protein